MMNVKLYKRGSHGPEGVVCGTTTLCIHCVPSWFYLARQFISGVLVEFGPTHKPELKGISHSVSEFPERGLVLVKFPDWETEWEGSWEDLRIMANQIADHLNLELEVER